MSKHTPGPWWVEPEEASAHRGLAICAADAVVATITPDENGPFPLDDTDQANARLIAASPGLLSTLEWTLEQLNTLTTDEYSKGGDKAIRERLQETINKARWQA